MNTKKEQQNDMEAINTSDEITAISEDAVDHCPECFSVLEYFREGSSQGCICKKCGWGVVTTYIEPIYEDQTHYSLIIKPDNEINSKTVMLIKQFNQFSNKRIVEILTEGNYVLSTELAPETKRIMEKLDECGVKYEITPEFKW